MTHAIRGRAARQIAHAGGPVCDQDARDALDDLGLIDDDHTETASGMEPERPC